MGYEEILNDLNLTDLGASKIRMPYKIPERRKPDPNALILDKAITSYKPLSDAKWYHPSKKAAELVNPELLEEPYPIKSPKYVKQLLIPGFERFFTKKRTKMKLFIVSLL